MIASEVARRACEALWLAMIDLAETANDEVITQQRSASAAAADGIATAALHLATLANAASVLARYTGPTAP